jgi:peptidoglycan-associated lipoprotein
MRAARLPFITLTAAIALTTACGGDKKPPATTPPGPASSSTSSSNPGASGGSAGGALQVPAPPVPTTASDSPVPSAPRDAPVSADPYAGQPPEVINKMSPLKPAFFAYDSDQLDETARQALNDDAELLKKYGTWVITIEGHSDERGTAEYNLALGERRALAARSYLLSLGLPADRFKTVSYGKEFPFDPGHNDAAWKTNRRAHLMVTANK